MERFRLRTFAGAVLVICTCISAPAAIAAGEGAVGERHAVPRQAPRELVAEILRLGERLGVDTRAGRPDLRAGWVIYRLGEMLDKGAEAGAQSELPIELLRALLFRVRRLGPEGFESRVEEAAEAEGLERRVQELDEVANLVELLHDKLDRREAAAKVKKESRLAGKVAPSNDDCAGAIVVTGALAASTLEATNDGSASCGDSATSPDVWFRYTAAEDGLVAATVSEATFDAVLSLHDACPLEGGVELACNDDSVSNGTRPQIYREMAAGEEVWVRLAGYGGGVGEATLGVGESPGVSGTVTKQGGGEPLPSARVEFRGSAYLSYREAWTDASGGFVTGIPEGTWYAVAIRPGYASEAFSEMPCNAIDSRDCGTINGDPLIVDQGVIHGVDFTLEPLGSLSGKVLADPGSPDPPTGTIRVYHDDGSLANYSGGWYYDYNQQNYLVTELAPGLVYVRTDSLEHQDQLYDGHICEPSCDVTLGDPIIIERGSHTPGIDFYLTQLGTIEGWITDEITGDGVQQDVYVYDAAGQAAGSEYRTTPRDGRYSVPALLPGEYFVRTESRSAYGYGDELYDDIPCEPSCDIFAGTPVSVDLATVTAGIDLALPPPGSMAGHVLSKNVEPGTMPIDGWVHLYDSFGDYAAGDRISSPTGAFQINFLAPGKYFVQTDTDYHQDEAFDDVQCGTACASSSGLGLVVQPGQVLGDIDFVLSECRNPSYITVPPSTIVSTLTHQSCEELTTSGAVRVRSSGDLTLRAGRRVVIRDGFAVESGGRLRVAIDPALSGKDD